MKHEFTPDHYHTTIGWHEPVLTIQDGDTVSTTTIDAGGKDKNGEQVSEGGNPQTGPFYVEGAEPGNILAVTFDHLMPNREYGHTSGQIAGNVLDPGYIPKFDDEASRFIWKIDFDNHTASPVEYTNDRNATRLGEGKPVEGLLTNLSLPLNPHSGCFGVAPARRQHISCATSANHGGNMDYKRFTNGVTVYLPIAAEGALFHIGDGHALQGDGEIVGTGIEISFDVTFTVRVIKGRSIEWPRAENDTHIMAIGNARPLDQCVEHASTEMIRFLEEEYGLTTREAHLLMGEAVEYDMGNMFDPAYTMVCKMEKAVLEGMGAKRLT
ncbi:MAG: acetamidase [Gemmatimonadetes bacterium]|nr:acetamidase [Gemmatimonadota bacterium]|tara:strand:+ start:771 stop:1745 length:975 start_codon:yes stop_codon:yes gene_type:complete